MMTWTEIRAHLHAGHQVIFEAPGRVALARRRARLVELQEVDLVEELGAPWLRIVSPVGPRAGVGTARALAHNLRLNLAALALDRDEVVLRALVPLAVLEPALLDRTLELVSKEAAGLRRSVAAAETAPS
jgi:hypothetical protein